MDKSEIINKLLNGEIKLYQIEQFTDTIDEAITVRREFIEKYSDTSLENISHYTLDMDNAFKKNIENLARGASYAFSYRGEYPAWEYKRESLLRDTMCRVYSELYGKDAEVIVIHAGLECGIFTGKIKDIDCVSIGPDNFDIHTPEERLSLSSSVRVWEYLKTVLKEI